MSLQTTLHSPRKQDNLSPMLRRLREHLTEKFVNENALIAVNVEPGTSQQTVGDIGVKMGLSLYNDTPSGMETDTFLLDARNNPQAIPGTLSLLLRQGSVRWAGPLVPWPACDGPSQAYLTQEMVVVIRPPANVEAVLGEAKALGYELLRRIPYGTPKIYHLRAVEHPGFNVIGHAEALTRIDGVVAEPNLAGISTAESVPIQGVLPSGLWDREQIAATAAWKKLAPAGTLDVDVHLAVVDGSFSGTEGTVLKRHLGEYESFDFRRWLNDPDELPGPFETRAPGHGVRAAGVAASRAEDLPGSAPGCHVRLLVYPVTEVDVLDMYVWLAGLDPESKRERFPKPLSRSADVVTSSVGFGFAQRLPVSVLAQHVFDLIAAKGRQGKGTLLFFSAGNGDSYATQERPWAAVESNFGVAASTLNGEGKPTRATYSNHHGVELCAPSSDNQERWIHSIDSQNFGGTSSATPLAAGVAALVLDARPELTHGEVRQILRSTAERIDDGERDDIKVWRNAMKEPVPEDSESEDKIYSNAYGFGQVHAARAVQAALDFERTASGKLAEVTKNDGKPLPQPTDGSGFRTASLILGVYHLLFALLLFVWPYADTRGLAGVSTLLGVYHLVIYAVLRARRRRFRDGIDEEMLIKDRDREDP